MSYYTYHNAQTGDSRWQKPAGPAAGKTPFTCYGSNSGTTKTYSGSTGPQHVQAEFINERTSGYSAGSPFASAAAPSLPGGLLKIIGGGALALIGLPLLILPGPGLLCIGGGAALVASGVNDLKKAATA